MSRGSARFSRRTALGALGAWVTTSAALGQTPLSDPGDWPVIDPAVLELLPNQMTRMAVPVSVNGQGPFYFVVDTGANRTSIAASLAAQLGLPRGPDVVVHGIASAELTPTAQVDALGVGPSRFRRMDTPLFPRARLGADGLLGVDALGGFRLVFEMAEGRLVMALSERTTAWGAGRASRLRRLGAVRGRQRFGQLTVIDVWVDGVRVVAFVDTGSQYTIGNVALFEAIGARRPELAGSGLGVPIVGVTGQRSRGQVATVRHIDLAGRDLLEAPVIFADLHAFDVWGLGDRPSLLLGADVIGRMRFVELDFGLTEIQFGPVTQLR